MQSESQSDCRCAPVCQPGRCSGAPAAVGWCKVKQRSLAFTRGAACFLFCCCRCFFVVVDVVVVVVVVMFCFLRAQSAWH